jgi:Fur family ferric uptake transcriptional regulator
MTLDIDRVVAEKLADKNLRYTDGRRRVVRALATSNGPQSAEDIHRRLRHKISLATLYRSLSQMEEAGVLSVLYTQGPTARFELADWLAGHHHHLVCENCGRIIEIELTSAEEAAIDEVVKMAAERAGFLPTDHVLEIDGPCEDCLASELI